MKADFNFMISELYPKCPAHILKYSGCLCM